MQFLPVKQGASFSLKRPDTSTIIQTTSSTISFSDRVKMILVRIGIGRNKYRIESGLYRLGNPTETSPVLVTANYGLTFNALRSKLQSCDVWILVIETFGINVWCAAGKGTFSTDEILHRIKDVRLSLFAPKATVIIPQLGASGVNIFKLIKESGFPALYGPIRAKDVSSFLNAGCKKSENMSTVTFSFSERLAVAWLEFALAWPLWIGSIPLSFLLSFISTGSVFTLFPVFSIHLFGSLLLATLGFPLFLPYIPSRIFAVKGAILALFFCICIGVFFNLYADTKIFLTFIFASLISVSLVSYLAMNFTGSTTFTCQRGAETEVRAGIIPMIVLLLLGSLGLIFLFIQRLLTLNI